MKAALWAWAIVILFACSGCATLRNPVPKELVESARIGDMSEIRIIVGMENTDLQKNVLESIKQEDPKDFPVKSDGTKIYPVLTISGGAANGAYGAGLLKGWSEEGSRPVFKAVTGVSTGAIIAPFAFLGKEYDAGLEEYYTTTSTKDIFKGKGIFAILFGDSFVSTKPLEKNIARICDDKFLEKIASEHRRGRRLFVGTVNLDAQRFVIWDMGAIACRGDAALFRKVILASASIPVMFPPTYFQVEAGGQRYDEMHVDGGTLTQVFALHSLLDNMEGAIKAMGLDANKIKSKLYIIRNGYVSARYKKVDGKLAAIAGQAMDATINAQGLGDLYRIYVFTHQMGNDYNLAFIPPDYMPQGKEDFDPQEMRRLFDRGYADAVKGYPWHKTPPSSFKDLESKSEE